MRWQVLVTAVLCTYLCGVVAEPPKKIEPAATVATFKRELKGALLEGLARGPANAIDACRIAAPEIAANLNRDGVIIGRTSDRLRNPANTAPAWVQPIMNAYLNDPDERLARTVALAGSRTGYVEPITAQPLCLTCHGSSLAPDVTAAISAHYPDDRAVGFRAGDLRGVFWVEIPTAGP